MRERARGESSSRSNARARPPAALEPTSFVVNGGAPIGSLLQISREDAAEACQWRARSIRERYRKP